MNNMNCNIQEFSVFDGISNMFNVAMDGLGAGDQAIEKMGDDYLSKYPNRADAIRKMLNNQITKCTVTGTITGLGGVVSLPITIPADALSALYIQIKMISTTAYMCNYDPRSDQVKTMILACLLGISVENLLADAGVRLGEKVTVEMIKKIPKGTLAKINKRAGFSLVTKFGEKGVICLGKVVPVVGAAVGGGMNLIEAKIIADRAYRTFYEGDFSSVMQEQLENIASNKKVVHLFN